MAALDKYRLADEEVPERRHPDVVPPVPVPVPGRPARPRRGTGLVGIALASGLAAAAGFLSLQD